MDATPNPAKKVAVADALSGTVVLREMVFEPNGTVEPDARACPVLGVLIAGTVPCTQIHDQCDISAETDGGAGEP